MDRIHVALFRLHLPFVVAAGSGAFGKHDISPQWTVVGSSGEQRALLESGRADLAHTAVDNVAAWHGPEQPWAVLRVVDLGLPHRLVARPPLRSLPDLRGGRIAVDSAHSGFVTMLRSVLAAAELTGEVEFVEVGALQRRLLALQTGTVDACLLGAEQLAAALAGGAQVIGSLNEFFPGYPGLVVSGVAPHVERHRELVGRYLAALSECAAWCFRPERRNEAIDLAAGVLGLDGETATAWYRAERERWSGTVGPEDDERQILARAWLATGRLGDGQPTPAGWFRPELAVARDASSS